MGVFGEVHWDCPTCGQCLSVQTKAGDGVSSYSHDDPDMPSEVRADVDNEMQTCPRCDTTSGLQHISYMVIS